MVRRTKAVRDKEAADAREPHDRGDFAITDNENRLIRKNILKGTSLLEMLDADLEAAWVALNNVPDGKANPKYGIIRGRIRGLAQAITTIRSPFSRQNLGADSAEWARQIKRTEDEALARVKAKGA